VFGAFCVGVVFPRNQAADRVMGTIAPLARIVFVPLFFTYSGLNTKFGLLANPRCLLGRGARGEGAAADRVAGRHPDERARPDAVDRDQRRPAGRHRDQ
jgi:hypothetical protein